MTKYVMSPFLGKNRRREHVSLGEANDSGSNKKTTRKYPVRFKSNEVGLKKIDQITKEIKK